MSQFGDPAGDFAKDMKGVLSPDERAQFERLARRIHHAHALGTRKENHIGSETFTKEDQLRVVHALMIAARHGGK